MAEFCKYGKRWSQPSPVTRKEHFSTLGTQLLSACPHTAWHSTGSLPRRSMHLFEMTAVSKSIFRTSGDLIRPCSWRGLRNLMPFMAMTDSHCWRPFLMTAARCSHDLLWKENWTMKASMPTTCHSTWKTIQFGQAQPTDTRNCWTNSVQRPFVWPTDEKMPMALPILECSADTVWPLVGIRAQTKHRIINEQWKNPGCLVYIGDYTTKLYRDYNKPL